MENTMLIVDDVEMNREILKTLFSAKYEILEAENGEEALEILEGCCGNIDIVLLDLLMPEMTGFELLEKKGELLYFKDVPVVVITSSGHMEDQVRAFELGASDFVLKPFVPEIVISRVNNVMASHRRMITIEMEAQKLKIKSEMDGMTGICNKATTEYSMNEVLRAGSDRLHALMVIDIDNFKAVNDISGHQEGDHVIKVIANLISSLFRKTDIVGRVGGDEFCVMMVDVPNMSVVYTKVNELIQLMRYKNNLSLPEYVSLSIGLASSHRRVISYAELFHEADTALYQAKENGKAQYQEFGVTPIDLSDDARPAVLLLSSNRGIKSVINALVPPQMRVVEVGDAEELQKVPKDDISKIKVVFADISDQDEREMAFFTALRELDLKQVDVFALCQEGKTNQYMFALQKGVTDIITTPIDNAAFKRRIAKQLEKLGIVEA